MRKTRFAVALAALAAVTTGATAPPPAFSGAAFEINRERVGYGRIKNCAKSATYLVPTTYLYVTARNQLKAGGGLGNASSKARVFIDGPTKAELQQLAGRLVSEIVGQLRAAGFTVLTYDDVKQDVAGKARMAANLRYGMPTHGNRAFPGMDFVVATPADDQTLDYGLSGPHANYFDAAKRTGATLLVPEIYLTMPQLGASASTTNTETWHSTQSSISFDPSMHLAGATVWGQTARGAWCSISVPEHGGRLAAPVVGRFHELASSSDRGEDWVASRGDFSFQVDDGAFQTGTLAVGRTLGKLIADAMAGRT